MQNVLAAQDVADPEDLGLLTGAEDVDLFVTGFDQPTQFRAVAECESDLASKFRDGLASREDLHDEFRGKLDRARFRSSGVFRYSLGGEEADVGDSS